MHEGSSKIDIKNTRHQHEKLNSLNLYRHTKKNFNNGQHSWNKRSEKGSIFLLRFYVTATKSTNKHIHTYEQNKNHHRHLNPTPNLRIITSNQEMKTLASSFCSSSTNFASFSSTSFN